MMVQKATPKIFTIGILMILLISGLSGLSFVPQTIERADAASTWTQQFEHEFKSGTLKNLTVTKDGNNASMKLTFTKQELWRDTGLTSAPSTRSEHAMAPIPGTDKVMLFGGSNYPWWWAITDDYTYIYHFQEEHWEQRSTPIRPYPRIRSAMAAIDGTDRVLMFGGLRTNVMNEARIYDYSDNVWYTLTTTNIPSARCDHAMATIDGTDKVLMFGGSSGSDETWVYDLSDNDWTQMTPTANPDGREEHAMAGIDGTDKVLMFGSSVGTGNDETWIYDLSDNIWLKLTPTTKPPGGSQLGMTTLYGTDQVMLFGGTSGNTDTWIFDLSDSTWTKKTGTTEPSARTSHAIATIDGTDNAVLFGGYRSSTSTYENDTWLLNSREYYSEGMYESVIYDTKACSDFNELTWDSIQTENATLKIQIRTTDEVSKIYSIQYAGPDGKSTSYYTGSPSFIWDGHDGDRWVQYRVLFQTKNKYYSPNLKRVEIDYNCIPCIAVLKPVNNNISNDNKPFFNWTFTDMDSVEQSAFQIVIDDEEFFSSIDYGSGEQASSYLAWQFPSGTAYKTIPDGRWYWKVRAKDSDGSWCSYSPAYSFHIDTQTPSSEIEFPEQGKQYNTISAFSGIADDPKDGAGINKIEVSIKLKDSGKYWDGESWSDDQAWLTSTGTKKWSLDPGSVDWISNEDYIIVSRATDNASNIEVPHSQIEFTLDFERPLSKIQGPSNGVWLNRLDQIVGSSIDVNGTGIGEVEVNIKRLNDSASWTGASWKLEEHWLDADGTNPWNFNSASIIWSSGTEYQIRSRAVDDCGNIEIPGSGVMFKFDDTPPAISMEINDGDKYTNHTLVELTLNSIDNGSGNHRMKFSSNGILWSDWESYNSTKSYVVDWGDGEKNIYYTVEDQVGNSATPVSESIILDTKPPTNLDILINDGATETDSVTVQLKLSALDELSGVGYMSFSKDGRIWTGWHFYNDTYQMYLDHGEGEKTVYFRVKDRAGNVAEPVKASIMLKTSGPDTKPDDDKPDDKNKTVDGQDDRTEDTKGFVNLTTLGIILAVVIIMVIVILMLILKKRKKPEKGDDAGLMTEGKKEGAQLMVDQPAQATPAAQEIRGTPGSMQAAQLPVSSTQKAVPVTVPELSVPQPATKRLPAPAEKTDQTIEPKADEAVPKTKYGITYYVPTEIVKLIDIDTDDVVGVTKPIENDEVKTD